MRPGLLRRYADWLHLRWPAGGVEPLPVVNADFSTNVPGLYVAGDLAGVPLLKLAIDSGVRAVRTIAARLAQTPSAEGAVDLAIVGGGVAGMAGAQEATRLGLECVVIEATAPFATLRDFPREKPIYAYPLELEPEGALRLRGKVKEELLEELRAQVDAAGIAPLAARAERVERKGRLLAVALEGRAPVLARAVLVAIGRSGDFRRLGVPGEELGKVSSRLHDPRDFSGQRVLVVGGGDSAIEAAVALAGAGAEVTLAARGEVLSRGRPENVDALARSGASVELGTRVVAIEPAEVVLESARGQARLPNDAVFTMIGRDAPLEFLRASQVRIRGERTPATLLSMAGFLALCVALYDWKSGGLLASLWSSRGWFPHSLAHLASNPSSVWGTVALSASAPAFWYTLAYSVLVIAFGARRIRTRRTAYVTAQTLTLIAVQVLPLFLLPEVLLPWLHHNGLLPSGLADALFPACGYGHGREFWRAYGLVLAWPLMIYNVMSSEPLGWWLAIATVQTFVLLPLGVRVFGKGFYCGWICSCGALAETLGDPHREKMPHGERWNRLNLAGQVILAVAVAMAALRVAGWALPDGNFAERLLGAFLVPAYKWSVDVFLGGVLGVGLYFWFSGRVWCRFFCPLAALMNLYARFSRFRILADKKKCISCNVCTAVCHQGIDVMAFANKGLPMEDPQCVRCSACVQSCPTGVLAFGRLARDGSVRLDRLPARSGE